MPWGVLFCCASPPVPLGYPKPWSGLVRNSYATVQLTARCRPHMQMMAPAVWSGVHLAAPDQSRLGRTLRCDSCCRCRHRLRVRSRPGRSHHRGLQPTLLIHFPARMSARVQRSHVWAPRLRGVCRLSTTVSHAAAVPVWQFVQPLYLCILWVHRTLCTVLPHRSASSGAT